MLACRSCSNHTTFGFATVNLFTHIILRLLYGTVSLPLNAAVVYQASLQVTSVLIETIFSSSVSTTARAAPAPTAAAPAPTAAAPAPTYDAAPAQRTEPVPAW